MANKKTTQTTEQSQPAEPTNPSVTEVAAPTRGVLVDVHKGDQLRIEDRDGSTATFACTMTVTKVGKDRVYCGSTAFCKDNGQKIGGNDHMFGIPAGQEGKGASKPEKTAKTKAPDKPEKKLSALDATSKVLVEAGQPMNCQDLIKAMAEKGYWTSSGGKTPHATLYAAILREITTKGADARVTKENCPKAIPACLTPCNREEFVAVLPGSERDRAVNSTGAVNPRVQL
jgi:hypothetical protein